MKRDTKIFIIFIVLFLAGVIPFKFTKTPEPYIFGWLPFPLFYWWIVIALSFIFLLWVAFSWIKLDEKGKEDKK